MTSLHPVRECSHAFVNISPTYFSYSDSLTVFIDGSKTESGVALSFCVVESGVLLNE